MKWSSDVPTVPGWYWYRHKPDSQEVKPVEIYEIRNGTELWQRGQAWSVTVVKKNNPLSEWCYISQPEEENENGRTE